MSTTPDEANRLKRKSLTGLDVEKLRGQDTPLGPEVSLRWVMVRENFEIAPFFMGNRWCRSATLFCNVTTPYKTLLSKENRFFTKIAIFRVFECFLWLEHECSVSPT